MQIEVGRRTSEYPVNRFEIVSHPELEKIYYSLREIANKYGSRNANARKIGNLLDDFTKALIAMVPQGAEYATVEIDVTPLYDAQETDQAARGTAKAMKPCGHHGCQIRIPLTEQMCPKCAHDDE